MKKPRLLDQVRSAIRVRHYSYRTASYIEYILLAQRRGGAEARRMIENEIGTIVVESAIAVHRELGPVQPHTNVRDYCLDKT